MFTRPWLWVLAAVVLSATAHAEPIRICIHDQANLQAPAQAALRAELRLLFPRLDIETKANPCPATTEGQVLVFVKHSGMDSPKDALGRAPMANGQILPSLEVFVEPIAELTGTTDLQILGRALGRVAAHELLHYLRQQGEHNETGLLQERLKASALMSEDRRDYVSLIALR